MLQQIDKTSTETCQMLDEVYLYAEYKNVDQNTAYNFEYIKPGKYTFRLIEDLNKNDIWDTGNYLNKIKPEPVYYFPSELEVRANWDLNETFNLDINQSVNDSIN